MSSQRKLSELEQAILKTVAYFDIFDYPLTLVEIYKWLYLPKSGDKYQLSDVLDGLESEALQKKIGCQNGFYFLAGRQDIIETRLYRYQLAEKKFQIALKATKWFSWFSFLKMVAICNNAGYNNATEKSDIDFFIVVKSGRLWCSRFFITLMANFLGVRRHKEKIIDRVCLSFYITDDHLNLSDIALKPLDPYLVYWFATLAPIYDQNQASDFFAANDWLNDYLPNFYRPKMASRRFFRNNFFINFSRKVGKGILVGFFGDKLEYFLRFIQLKKMKKNIPSVADVRVIINDEMLKFHETDRREEYLISWQQRLNKLELF